MISDQPTSNKKYCAGIAAAEWSGKLSGGYMFADEYALEYCNTDEDGEFLDGSDLDLAEKEA